MLKHLSIASKTMTTNLHISDEYLKLNKELHQTSEAFGNGGDRWYGHVWKVANQQRAMSILDYGCGKGTLEKALKAKGFNIYGYDPAVEEYSKYPKRKADFVVCCDVLEHIEEEYLGVVLDDLKRFSRKAFFAVVALAPSNKLLSNGENAHISLFPSECWMNLLLSRFPKGKRLLWKKQPNKLLFQWIK